MTNSTSPDRYQQAGVNIAAGNQLVSTIKSIAKQTQRSEVLTSIGGFAALCELPQQGYKNPVLASATDGVGTKLRLALDMQKHDTIGIDLVAMCVNDLIICGAEPLFFLDYYATGKLEVDTAQTIIQGIGDGCKLANVSLVGGETAEMPGMYADKDYDLAGFCVGIVEKTNIIDGSLVKPGDRLIGIASSGPHSNGYSLIRDILKSAKQPLDTLLGEKSLGEILLTPTRIYVNTILSLIKKIPVHAMAHITGGGLLENIPRVMPPASKAIVNTSSWTQPEIFNWLRSHGDISEQDMYRTFNCGVGMVICVAEADVSQCLEHLSNQGEQAWEMGYIAAHNDKQPVVIMQ